MDTSHGIVLLTGSDGVKRDKTWQIERIEFDAQKSLYLVKFSASDKTFFYKKENVQFVGNAAAMPGPAKVLDYLKSISSLCDITNDAGENVLARNFEGLKFVHPCSALSFYLDPGKYSEGALRESSPIFPFGCNGSQFDAVKKALDNRLSIIQGPPGTGKTQTILNIVSNLVADGRTVLVVSNNNSAIENVREKLSAPDSDFGFCIASLGKVENIVDFLKRQTPDYPLLQLRRWTRRSRSDAMRAEASEAFVKMKRLFELRERTARQRQELSALETEYRHFCIVSPFSNELPVRRFIMPSDAAMDLLVSLQADLDMHGRMTLFCKFLLFFKHGIGTWRFWRLKPGPVLRLLKERYYLSRMRELKYALLDAEKAEDGVGLDRARAMSMTYLKHVVAEKYLKKEIGRRPETRRCQGRRDFVY